MIPPYFSQLDASKYRTLPFHMLSYSLGFRIMSRSSAFPTPMPFHTPPLIASIRPFCASTLPSVFIDANLRTLRRIRIPANPLPAALSTTALSLPHAPPRTPYSCRR